MCKNNKKISVMYLTYDITEDLSELQTYVLSRVNTESSICGYKDGNNLCQELKTRTTTVSNAHLIIEIIKWAEGLKNNYYNNNLKCIIILISRYIFILL